MKRALPLLALALALACPAPASAQESAWRTFAHLAAYVPLTDMVFYETSSLPKALLGAGTDWRSSGRLPFGVRVQIEVVSRYRLTERVACVEEEGGGCEDREWNAQLLMASVDALLLTEEVAPPEGQGFVFLGVGRKQYGFPERDGPDRGDWALRFGLGLEVPVLGRALRFQLADAVSRFSWHLRSGFEESEVQHDLVISIGVRY